MSAREVIDQEDTQVVQLKQDAAAIEVAAREIEVVDETGLSRASDILGWIAKTKKAMEERRKFLVGPLQDQVKRINDWFKSLAAPLDTADALLRQKVLAYRQEQERKRRKEEERLRKLAEAEQKKLAKQAAKTGAPLPPPIPIPVMPAQPKTTQSTLADVTTKTVWDFEIVDEAKLPRQYLMPNEKAIRAAVKSGIRSIPGIRIFQTEQLAVKAR